MTEARTVANLDHANIVPVHDVGQWSPDGKRIAYIGSEGKPQIYVCDADGSEVKQLSTLADRRTETAPGAVTEALFLPVRWSADGKRLYFNRPTLDGDLAKKSPLYVIDADGKNEKELTKGGDIDLLGGAGFFVVKTVMP